MNETKRTALPPLEGDTGEDVINLKDILGLKDVGSPDSDMLKFLKKAQKKKETITVKIQSGDSTILRAPMGDITGIIHADEMDPDRSVALAGFVGTSVRVKVLSVDPEKGEAILSRKAAREEDAKNLLLKIKRGDVVKGIVKVMLPYGCLVELGGIAGLLKNKDIAHRPVKAEDIFKVGQSLEVSITEISKNGKIYLSTKVLIPKPGPEFYKKYTPGSHWEGEVISVHSFGVFVNVGGAEALCSLPASGRIHPGQRVSIKINQVIPEEGKLHGNIKRFLS